MDSTTRQVSIRVLGGRVRRRHFLSVAGGAATAAILAACGETPAAPTTAPTAAVPATRAVTTGAATGGTTTPATMSATTTAPTTAATAPTAAATTAAATPPTTAATTAATTGAMTAGSNDAIIPSPNPEIGVPDAYRRLPPPFKAVPETPGRGGRTSAFVISYDPPAPGRENNRYWQELDKRLGTAFDATIAPSADYEAKFAAVIAGGDLPDLVFFSPPPGYERVLLQGAFTDLTPYLTGDGLREFPNLARFPSAVWRNSALNKKIYGVPRPRFIATSTFYFRQDWAEKVGFGTQKTADDVFNMFVGMSKMDPDGNGKADTFGLSSNSPRPTLAVTNFAAMFRAPNEWRLNPDGSLTHMIETDEYRQTLDFARRLWAAGGYHPDAANLTTNQNKDLFYGGKIGAYDDGLSGLFSSAGARAKTRELNPTSKVTGWVPPGHDGGKPTFHRAIGYFGFTAIPAKVGRDKERVKELLRLLNYFAAPIGSEENTFLAYGLENVHFTYKNGLPVKNDLGKAEIGTVSGTQGVVLAGLTNPPQVALYDEPGDAEEMQKLQANLLSTGIDNPTWGYYSPTAAMSSAILAQLRADALASVVTGRSPLASWNDTVRDWRSRGGDMMRKEYEAAIKGT